MKVLLLIPLFFIIACAATGDRAKSTVQANLPVPVDPVISEKWDLVKGAALPEADSLIAEFYGGKFVMADIDKKVEAALKKYPDNSALHEIAAYLSVLKDDTFGQWYHFMKAASDINSPLASIYLWEMDNYNTVNRKNEKLKLLSSIIKSHPDPYLRALASQKKAELEINFGDLDAAKSTIKPNGYIKDWMLIGAFDNDQGKGFYEVYPPETEIDYGKRYKGKAADIGWRPVQHFNNWDGVPLENIVSPSGWTVSYLLTFIHSDTDNEAIIFASTGDPLKMWLNDAPVFSDDSYEGWEADNAAAEIKLNKGWNKLLVKTANNAGSWQFAARLTDKKGEKLGGISFSAVPQSYAKAPSQILPEKYDYFKALSGIANDNRKNFFFSRLLTKNGRHKDAKPWMLKFNENSPDNLLSMYFTAVSYEDNDEEGKLIDILGRGIAQSSETAAGFLVMRGNFYKNKGLKDKADEDYKKALKVNPQSFGGYRNLAALFKKRNWNTDRCMTVEIMRSKWPDSTWTQSDLADCYYDRGFVREAEALYMKARELEPGGLYQISSLMTIMKRKQDYSSSLLLADKMIALESYDPSNYTGKAEIFRIMRNYPEAENMYKKAAEISPDWVSPYDSLAVIEYELGKKDEALKYWNKAHALNPNDANISERIAYLTEKEKDMAEEYLPSEKEIAEAIKSAEKAAVHPAAQVLMIIDHSAVRINSDGSSKWFITEVKKAVNEEGRDKLINVSLPYTGTTKVLQAYSLDNSGLRQEASSISGSQIRFRKLATGCVTVVQYLHYMPAPRFLENNFVGDWYLQTPYDQILTSKWILIYPEDKTLNIDMNAKVEEKNEKRAGHNIKTFTASGLNPVTYELMSPPLYDFFQKITVSTVSKWDEYVNWERALLKDAFVSNKDIRELSAKLTSGAKDKADKLNKIFQFMAQDIRYQQEYETTIAGVKPHSSAQILERGYGDCKDKAVLFIQLAKESAVKVNYAILRTRSAGKVQTKIPNQQFNHAIVYIPAQEGIANGFFMDPTVDALEIGNLRSDDQGATSIVMDPDTGRYEFMDIPYQTPAINYEKHKISYKVDKTGKVELNDSMEIRGGTSSAIRKILRTKEHADKLFQSLAASEFQGAKLIKASNSEIEDIWKPLTIDLTADASNLLSDQGDKMRLKLPDEIIDSQSVKLTERKLPLDLGIKRTYKSTTEVELPKGSAIEYIPPDFSFNYKCFSVSRKGQKSGVKVTITDEYTKECTIIPPEEYVQFKKAVQDVVNRQEDYIIFSAGRN